MREKIVENEMSQLDHKELELQNITPHRRVNQMPQIRRINTILDNAVMVKAENNHTEKVGKRRLKFRDSVDVNPLGHV